MKEEKKDRLGLSAGNYILLVIAFVVITAGYIIMAGNDITVSPIMLFVAYIIIIPIALVLRFKKKD